MSGAAFLRIKKLKGSGIIGVAARHNRRVIQAEAGASGSIDPKRSHLNETLHGPLTADGVGQLAKDLMREAGVVKYRKDSVMGLEFVFSLPADHKLDDRAYFADCAAWVANQYGGDQNVLSVDIHRDEAAPHCHVLLLPLEGGKLVGSDMVGGRQKLMTKHQHFHDTVASRYGLRRAPARLSGATKQAAAAAVVRTLRTTSDPALKSKAWPTLREAIENDPGPFMLALDIRLDAAPKTGRTMAQIFTSKGKGRAKEANPIGFGTPSKQRTLCSVGFTPERAPELAPKTPPAPAPDTRSAAPAEAAHDDVVRVRDDELDPALYDPVTGEYFQKPPSPRSHRAAADAWVATALGALRSDRKQKQAG